MFCRKTMLERAQENLKHADRRRKQQAQNAVKGAEEALKKTQAAFEAAKKDQAKYESELENVEEDLAADRAILKQLQAKQKDLAPQIASLEKCLAR
jgi:hypothetical protein